MLLARKLIKTLRHYLPVIYGTDHEIYPSVVPIVSRALPPMTDKIIPEVQHNIKTILF